MAESAKFIWLWLEQSRHSLATARPSNDLRFFSRMKRKR
jgi:hypothetical protein